MKLPRLHLAGLFGRPAPVHITPAPVRPPAFRYSLTPSAGLDVSTISSGDTRVEPLVMLEGRDLPLELHCNLTAIQARALAIRLLQAADTCDEVTLDRATRWGTCV